MNIRWPEKLTDHDAAAMLKTIEGLPGKESAATARPFTPAAPYRPKLTLAQRTEWHRLVTEEGWDVNVALHAVRPTL
jgi:hypothetical protein